MKKFCCVFVLWFCGFAGAFAQTDSSRNMVKYTRDFKFKDGIFMNFNEFKNNAPSVTQFEVVKDKTSGSETDIYLKYNRPDTSGNKKKKVTEQCFGYAKNGVLYFSDGNYGFYRMFIVGALSHFMQYQQSSSYYDHNYNDPSMLNFSANDIREYLLDFETGETFLFNYHDFKDFLKTHDADLLNELEHSKNKRDMIHHFLLKYNEKHPIYFPVK
jgi:hypothetical protein